MIYDIHTKNTSFLKISRVLLSHGVKNNKFMLVLYDETLVGVDPHSDNLTSEQKIRIYREICKNPWYFLREVSRIPVPGKLRGTEYALNLGNCAQSYAYLMNLNFISTLCRQSGKTIGHIALDVWVLNFGATNEAIVYLNKGQADSIENGKRFKDMKNLLPGFLKDMIVDKTDKDNTEEKYIAKLNNKIHIKSPPNNAESADRTGRGLTVPLIYIDEFAFINYIDIVYDALYPAFKTASENAKHNGVPYGIHLSTTPNNIDTTSGNFAYRFIENACPFCYELYDMNPTELKEYINNNSLNNFVFIKYTWKELGRNEEWYNTMCKEMASAIKVKREIDLEWPRSDENSLFTEEQLDKLFLYVKDQKYSLNIRNNIIRFYDTPDFQKKYIISCDVSGGTDQDNSAISIIDPRTFACIGSFKSPKIDTNSYYELIKDLCTLYFANSIIVIERNSYGLNIIDRLIKDPKIEPRVFREYAMRTAEKVIENGIAVKTKKKKLIYGIDTTSKSRKLMMDLLSTIVEEEPECVVSPLLFDDIKHLTVLPNNRIEAMQGFHDDILMSYLIARYAIQYGTAMQKIYGIRKVRSEENGEGSRSGMSALAMLSTIDTIEATAGSSSSELSKLVEEQQRINKQNDVPKKSSSAFFNKIAGWND